MRKMRFLVELGYEPEDTDVEESVIAIFTQLISSSIRRSFQQIPVTSVIVRKERDAE